jgi:hypothetical protein
LRAIDHAVTTYLDTSARRQEEATYDEWKMEAMQDHINATTNTVWARPCKTFADLIVRTAVACR